MTPFAFSTYIVLFCKKQYDTNTSLCVDFPLECYKFTVILFVAKSKGSLENPNRGMTHPFLIDMLIALK